jgi:flagellar assembly protein FliH
MSSSKEPRDHFRNIPPPQGAAKPNAYTRFIPREELDSFAAWQPGTLGGEQTPAEASRSETKEEAQAQKAAQLQAARRAGYADGYRDGLAALEGFKATFTQQVAVQLGALVDSFSAQLDALQSHLAGAVTRSATALARQVVREELLVHPEHIATIAQDAIDALLQNARHVRVRVNPDDLSLVAQGAADALRARGAHLVADDAIMRGGCEIDSDIGLVDATIEARWRRAAAALGSELPWTDAALPVAREGRP